MSTIDTLIKHYEFNRGRTLGLLDAIEQTGGAAEVLGWRPGAGRAHIAWQLMHIAITEEIFASERLATDKPQAFTELWPRYKGGSTPDDEIPSSDEIESGKITRGAVQGKSKPVTRRKPKQAAA